MPATTGAEFDTLALPSRQAWRAWLAEHHATACGILLALPKKNNPQPGLTYEEAVEEALCFGWIDSKAKTLDKTRFRVTFSPRKPGSVWARSNKERVARLIEQGLMTPAGLAIIEAAKANGTWSAYDDAEDLVVPEDLAAALEANPPARQYWDGFTASTRRMILYYVASARRPETRARRIVRTAEMARENLRINIDQP